MTQQITALIHQEKQEMIEEIEKSLEDSYFERVGIPHIKYTTSDRIDRILKQLRTKLEEMK